MIKSAKTRELFCGESFVVRCVVFHNHARITFKCLAGRYTLRVYDNGKFEFDFPLNTMWDYEVKNFLEKKYFELIKIAC